MRKCFALLSVVAGMSLLAAFSPRQALAGTLTVKFVMPQTVDPKPLVLKGNDDLTPNPTDLLATSGIELHGQAQVQGNKAFYDIGQIVITIKFNGSLNVDSLVPKFSGLTPWVVTKSFDSGSGKWTITFTPVPNSNSAVLSDAFPDPFHHTAVLNAYSGNGTTTPLGQGDIHIKGIASNNPRLIQNTNIVDTTGPSVTVAPNPPTIWSPNGNLVPVKLSGALNDLLGGADNYVSGVNPSSGFVKVTNNQTGDIQTYTSFTPTFNTATNQYDFVTIFLEAARLGQVETGRVYTVAITFADNFGNSTTVTTTVSVVHDQGG